MDNWLIWKTKRPASSANSLSPPNSGLPEFGNSIVAEVG